MSRTVVFLGLIAALIASGCGFGDYEFHRRPRPHHRRHHDYRTTEPKDDAADDSNGTPIPDQPAETVPAPVQTPPSTASDESLKVLKSIAEKLDQQPKQLDQSFKTLESHLMMLPDKMAAKLVGPEPKSIPQASPPMQAPPSESAPVQSRNIAPPESRRPDVPYTGVKIHRKANCIPADDAERDIREIIGRGSKRGWSIGRSPHNDFWILDDVRPDDDCPIFESWNKGRIDSRKTIVGYNGDAMSIFRLHPLYGGEPQTNATDSGWDDWERTKQRIDGPQQSNCSRPNSSTGYEYQAADGSRGHWYQKINGVQYFDGLPAGTSRPNCSQPQYAPTGQFQQSVSGNFPPFPGLASPTYGGGGRWVCGQGGCHWIGN